MRRFFSALIMLALAGAAGFFFLTRPNPLPANAMAGLAGNAEAGEMVFHAAGCASCHAAPEAKGDDKLVLAGGRKFPSDFGTFIAPNISPHPENGIGAWSALDLANAMLRGVSPDGAHYFPAFPYTSYARAELQDVADLKAFLDTLPVSDSPNQRHEVGFPFNIRRSLGGWKLLFARDEWVVAAPASPQVERGRYLVEALGHCGECHTPRNALGGLDYGNWLAGAPVQGGSGKVLDLRPHVLDWSAEDIAYYLDVGFSPDFDGAGGHMVDVIENFALLPAEDRDAVAAYLKALPTPAN